MTRPLRIEYEDAVYHVMNRGLAGGDVFKDEEDNQNFINVIKEANQHWKIHVYAYCLMKNVPSHLSDPSFWGVNPTYLAPV